MKSPFKKFMEVHIYYEEKIWFVNNSEYQDQEMGLLSFNSSLEKYQIEIHGFKLKLSTELKFL